MEVVRHQQQPVGLLQQLWRLALYRHELVDGVEALFLDAGAPVQLLGGDALLHQGVHALGAAVPIGHRVPQDAALLVHQGEVHPPGVHPRVAGTFPSFAQAFRPFTTSRARASKSQHRRPPRFLGPFSNR